VAQSLWPQSQGMRFQVSGVAPLRLCESKAVILFGLVHPDMSETEGPEMAKKHRIGFNNSWKPEV
jgi:hypothetical protein